MSQGRLPVTRTASAMAARRALLVSSAAGTRTRAVIAIAANPPITAGTSDRHSRAVQRHGSSVRAEHRPQDPGQAGVAEQQGPLADDEALGDVRVPDVEHATGQAGQQGLAVQEGDDPGAAEHEDR